MSSAGETACQARIARNLDAIRARVEQAARKSGRAPQAVRLIAVTKYVGLDEMTALLNLGVRELAESRPQQALPKLEALRDHDALWHMVGPVQRRKARDVVRHFDCVDSVDRVAVAEALQQRCEEQDRRIRVLIQVNVAGEAQKHGFTPEETAGALAHLRALDRLEVEGLMTMAPFDADEPVLRRVFGGLRELARAHALPELSMGMSQDFEVAVEEGATQVRLGSALFE